MSSEALIPPGPHEKLTNAFQNYLAEERKVELFIYQCPFLIISGFPLGALTSQIPRRDACWQSKFLPVS